MNYSLQNKNGPLNIMVDQIRNIAHLSKKRMFLIQKERGDNTQPSPLQARITFLLSQNEDLSLPQTVLEGYLHVSKAAISGALSAMEARGTITRASDKRDNRNKIIQLTESGKRQVANFKKNIRQIEKELLVGIPPGELESFSATLNKMQQNLIRNIKEENV